MLLIVVAEEEEIEQFIPHLNIIWHIFILQVNVCKF